MNENRFRELKEKIDFWASNQEVCSTARYLAQLSEKEKQQVIEEANLVMKYTVMLHDPETKQKAAVPHRRNEEMWIQHYEEHPQWTYELNRHDFLYTLLYASVITGEKMYAGMLRWYIFDWMIKNPIVLSGTETTRPADTGLRCMNWCGLILQMIADGAIDEEDTVVYFQNMGMQFEYLRRKYVGSNTINSQGVPQTAAMCAAYVWFSEFLSQEDGLEQWAWKELKQQLELQVLEDGSHRADMDSCDGAAGDAFELVLEMCEKLLSYCQGAERSGVKLREEAVAAIDAHEGWLVDAVRRMRKRLLYMPGKAGKGISEADDRAYSEAGVPLYLYSQDSEKLLIRSDWSAEADYTWMGQVGSSCGLKSYVRERDGIYYAEMFSADVPGGDSAGSLIQADRLIVLPGGIWTVSQKTVDIDEKNVNASEAAERSFAVACETDAERYIWSISGSSAKVQVCSDKMLEQKALEDQRLVILAPADVQVKPAAVFQFGRPAPLAKKLVTALDVKLPPGEAYTVILWNGKVDKGSKMFLCHGVPVCGNVVVLCGTEKDARQVLLKN